MMIEEEYKSPLSQFFSFFLFLFEARMEFLKESLPEAETKPEVHGTRKLSLLKEVQSLPLASLFVFPVPGPTATCPQLMMDENRGEPRNFRSPRWFLPPDGCLTDMTGFGELPISANAQCGSKGWSEVVKKIRTVHAGMIVNLSLRQEAYAYVRLKTPQEEFSSCAPEDVEYSAEFLPVSWFTKEGNWAQVGLSNAEAQQWNALLVGTLNRQESVTIIWPNNSELPSKTFLLAEACAPRDIAKMHGMKFRRLFITDHCGPRLETS